MAFEVWEQENIGSENWIRLSKNSIVISKSMKSILGNYVQIAYDKKIKTIRMKSVGKDEPCITMEKTKIIGASSFFKKFGIANEETSKYEAIWNEQEKAYFIKLG